MRPHGNSYLRSLLILGRVSNLPTVWSNCLAGWLLAGGGSTAHFVQLTLGTTFLYLGGMFLNDAFDADFDRQNRPERPIPSGAIDVGEVWKWGSVWLILGVVCLSLLGLQSAILAFLLAISILLYDSIHKIFILSPVIMAACRFLVILIASSAATAGITGLSIWSALVLAAYIVGLSYMARTESSPGPLRYWPLLFLAAPVILAMTINRGDYLWRGIFLSALLVVWIANCARHAYAGTPHNVARMIGGLLAGIVLVDLLAVASLTLPFALLFLSLFLLALAAQRFIPPT